MPNRLCILTQYFPPEMGAPQARLSELGERLVDRRLGSRGAHRTAELSDRQESSPATIRASRASSRSAAFARSRATLYGQNRLHEAASLLFLVRCLGLPPRAADVPAARFAVGRVAAAVHRLRGPQPLAGAGVVPFVFNVSDLWPESAIRMGIVKPGVATSLAERFERKLYRKAAGVTGQSAEIIDAVQECVRRACARTSSPMASIPSASAQHLADAEARALVGDEPGPIFIFAGLLGLAQGLDQILDLAAALPADLPGRFVLVGEGPGREHLMNAIERRTDSRASGSCRRSRANAFPRILAAADVGLDQPGNGDSRRRAEQDL